jgi:hypothetical protein
MLDESSDVCCGRAAASFPLQSERSLYVRQPSADRTAMRPGQRAARFVKALVIVWASTRCADVVRVRKLSLTSSRVAADVFEGKTACSELTTCGRQPDLTIVRALWLGTIPGSLQIGETGEN